MTLTLVLLLLLEPATAYVFPMEPWYPGMELIPDYKMPSDDFNMGIIWAITKRLADMPCGGPEDVVDIEHTEAAIYAIREINKDPSILADTKVGFYAVCLFLLSFFDALIIFKYVF